jgi:antitoxin component YwqK of YwqJK toxin-antitoxin module
MINHSSETINHLLGLFGPYILLLTALVVLFKNLSKNETFHNKLRIFGLERYLNMNIFTLRKMRLILTVIALFSINMVFAHASGSQNNGGVTDANGLRQNHWVIYNDTRHLPGYEPSAKVEEGDYKDNMKQGIWVTYFPSGAVKSKITFKDNRPEGYCITYFENGNVQEEGTWSNNRWTGAYKLRYENGTIQHEFTYNDNGKRSGENKYYYPNGKLMIDENCTDGKQTGVTTEYYDDGTVKAKEVFNNGALDTTKTQRFEQKTPQKPVDVIPVPVQKEAPTTSATVVTTTEQPNPGASAAKIFNGEGYWKLYNKNKQVSKDGYFHGGKLMDGTIYIYNGDGILQKKAVYSGGVYQGDSPITEEDKK